MDKLLLFEVTRYDKVAGFYQKRGNVGFEFFEFIEFAERIVPEP
jgi:hypothetical protein